MSNTGIFLRCPVSVAERIRAVIRQENIDRAAAKLDPFALYKGEPCLPPFFARAGEREASRLEGHEYAFVAPRICSDAREATLNVNFDVSQALAARCVAAIRAMNKAARAAKGEPICLRSGQPSLPQFFLRAGLLELERDEERLVSDPLALAKTMPGRPITLRRGAALAHGQTRSDAVRVLLRRAPATMDDLVAAGFTRYEARNTISSLVTKGDVVARSLGGQGKSVYALTAAGQAKAVQPEET